MVNSESFYKLKETLNTNWDNKWGNSELTVKHGIWSISITRIETFVTAAVLNRFDISKCMENNVLLKLSHIRKGYICIEGGFHHHRDGLKPIILITVFRMWLVKHVHLLYRFSEKRLHTFFYASNSKFKSEIDI